MPCYYPIAMAQLFNSNKNGNRSIVSLKSLRISDKYTSVKLPCGRCVGCRLERARQWAMRCVHEMSLWKRNTFVTLTYADDSLTFGGAEHGILVPRDLTLFWKRLRKSGARFKYFACGEYGDLGNRPHYHAIIFGHDFEDKVYHSSKGGNNYYRSFNLNRLWGHGDCIIGNATFESASYVARYVMKKRLGKERDYYAEKGITPEFVVMSRGNAKTGPNGIGREWYDRYEEDVFPRDSVAVRGFESVPPRYYTQRFKASHPLEAEDMISRRVERAELNWEENEPKRLKVRERIKRSAISSLSRTL